MFLYNAKIVSHKEVFEGAVFLKDGLIEKVFRGEDYERLLASIKGEVDDSGAGEVKSMDLGGKFLLPGLIDTHVHFREPGASEKEDWAHAVRAALAGGVTTVFDMPNNNPAIVDAEALEEKRVLVRKAVVRDGNPMINFGFFLGATLENVEWIKDEFEKNGVGRGLGDIVGVKVYYGSSTGNLLMNNLEMIERLLRVKGLVVAVHAEDEGCVKDGQAKYLGVGAGDGGVGSGDAKIDPSVHSKIRAPICSYEAVKVLLELAERTDGSLHLCHVSTEGELDLVREAGLSNVSAEACPHHLFFTDSNYEQFGNVLKVNPPVRSGADLEALWDGVRDGLVDIISTDHAPHLLSEKRLPYVEAPSGVPGVQERLPLLLNEVYEGRLKMEKLVEVACYNPAVRFGLRDKGVITAGADADLVVVDMEKENEFRGGLLENHYGREVESKCRWSLYEGRKLKGWPVMTYAKGELKFNGVG